MTLDIASKESIYIKAHLKLPPPRQDVHSIIGYFHTKKGTNNVDVDYLANYRALISKQNYAASGKVSKSESNKDMKFGCKHVYACLLQVFIKNEKDIKGNLKVDWGLEANQTVNNMLELNREGRHMDVAYRLQTAKHAEDTLNTKLTYAADISYQNVT